MDRRITLKSKTLFLAGRRVKEGDSASQFYAVDSELKEVKLTDYKDSIKIITSFLSLDTPTCNLQVKEFNKRASKLAEDIVVIGISQDLPFAQKRFCEANKIEKVITLSDYKTNSFGINYGLLIKELRLLARAVIIVDKNNVIRYVSIVQEASDEPDYQSALKALKDVIEKPFLKGSQERPSHCLPCEAGTPPLKEGRIEQLMATVEGWELIEGKKIKKTFKFKDFIEAKYFLDIISVIAEEQGHHPNITIIYNKVTITLTTHAIGGLSDNDFIMAQIIDEIGGA
ncbi:MAG: thiol peroxidase [Candidatus Omnitrophica bacterium]|nr:thiol peroxidase [Candidatus Omnitrophota bacterium]